MIGMIRTAMRSRWRFSLVALLLAFFGLLWAIADAPVASSVSFTVTTTDDHYDGECTPSDCSLREALALAAPGDTVNVPAGTYTVNRSLFDSTALTVNRRLTIAGAGASRTIIQANAFWGVADYSVLAVDAGQFTFPSDVRISGVTFRHGGGHQGGGLDIRAGDVTLTDVAVVDNRVAEASPGVGGNGGGIATSAGVVLRLERVTISGNSATYYCNETSIW